MKRWLYGSVLAGTVALIAACSSDTTAPVAARPGILQPPPVADLIEWDKLGVLDGGVCKTFETDAADLEPGPGEQGWLFVLTQPGDPPPAHSLTATFSPGGTQTVGPSQVQPGSVHFAVYTAVGATLVSASAENGTAGDPGGSNLTVSHCEVNDITIEEAEDPTVEKTATGSYDNTYTWSIDKRVDKTLVQQNGGTATFNYTVEVNADAGTISNTKVTGTITAHNPNAVAIALTSITDQLSNSVTCTITNPPTSLPPGDTPLAYSCNLSALPSGSIDNTVTVTWPEQQLTINSQNVTLAGGSAHFGVEGISFTGNNIDECVSVSDSYAGSLGTVCVGVDVLPKAFTYARTVNVPAETCVQYDNTATFTTNDKGATGSDQQSVNVCGRVTSGLTMGFWGNKNGQDLIANTTYSGTACATLKTYLTGFNPFKDYAGTTCNNLKTYTTSVFTAANASGAAMNAMLKGQMLATALSVYFSNLGAIPGGNLGLRNVDLTLIPKPVNSTTYKNTSAVFGGGTCQTVSALLTYASGQSNSGGSVWYGQVKATQENAKDTFDAINNKVVFACP